MEKKIKDLDVKYKDKKEDKEISRCLQD